MLLDDSLIVPCRHHPCALRLALRYRVPSRHIDLPRTGARAPNPNKRSIAPVPESATTRAGPSSTLPPRRCPRSALHLALIQRP